MKRFARFRLIRQNQRLAYRRSPVFEQGQIAKVLTFLGASLFVIYLIGIGVALGMGAREEGVGFIMVALPFILLVDFFLRFLVQQTPTMLMKPYILLPMSKYTVIEDFLLSSVTSTYNILWLSLFIPYAIIAYAGGATLNGCMMAVLVGEMFIVLNSQFYLFMRTLLNRNLLWWLLLPCLVAMLCSPLLIWSLDEFKDGLATYGITIVGLLAVVILTVFMIIINRRLQFRFVYEEISRSKATTIKHVREFTFLNRYGETGEYLKLEIKSVMRNKVMRARFWSSLVLIIVFSALIAYTPIYNDRFSVNFWCFYCFGLYGITSLIKVMCPEGNYIDLLMTNRENILSLLKAKYYFHCAILVVPFIVLLPAVFTGKFTLLMMFAYMFICTGVLYMILFELAIYNKQTLPLQQKLTGKGNFENGRQLIIELIAFALPAIMVTLLLAFFSETVAYTILIAIGLVITVAHPWWLRRVYKRMMSHRYENLEGFHNTR